nr:RING-H2 finger protein ATL74-like [Ziziphus jujuba var. spinosa]
MVFPSQMLKEDLLGCQTYIRDKLITAELGYNSPPTFRTNIAPLTARLVEIADRLNMDYDQTVDVINIEDEEEDGLLDEQVTSRTRTSNTAIKKLKVSGRFVIADHKKKELASCCICLEEMFDGKKLLVGLPKCKHVHHESCILHWLDYTISCPLCR